MIATRPVFRTLPDAPRRQSESDGLVGTEPSGSGGSEVQAPAHRGQLLTRQPPSPDTIYGLLPTSAAREMPDS